MIPDTCTLIIVDDHRIFRNGLKLLLKKIKWVRLIGEAENCLSLRSLLKTTQPDVLVMDISMPNEDGISCTNYIREQYPQIRIMAMTVYTDNYTIQKMMSAGAAAYLTKDASRGEFEHALVRVINGKTYITPEAGKMYESNLAVLDVPDNTVSAPINLHDLTSRELQILRMIAGGNTNKTIAEQLSISQRTVEKHRYRLLKKLSVNNAAELFYKLSKYNLL